jgi:trehalose/maltose hydrolase-like predicted phosphorylase
LETTVVFSSKYSSSRLLALAAVACLAIAALAGCNSGSQPDNPSGAGMSQHDIAQQANQLFLTQKAFDPWVLSTSDPDRAIDAYVPVPTGAYLYGPNGYAKTEYYAGRYDAHGCIVSKQLFAPANRETPANGYAQTLDLRKGTFTTVGLTNSQQLHVLTDVDGETWPQFWAKSDIVIGGDPEAEQVTHANMFYLAGSSTGADSIPPMGLSSNVYAGHIFWDAEIWMMPALVAQHPDIAAGMIDYRFNRLAAAEKLAAAHGYRGAEYPWESADTGKEEAPAEFAQERHITADVAFAAWQYYLWTGDKPRLRTEIWPMMKACADYWVSRAKLGADGKYHIANVIGPDETSGVVSDDAWTNAIVAETLRDTALAAAEAGQAADPKWATVASKLALLKVPATGIYIEHQGADSHLMAKQADAQMLIYPLHVPMSPGVAKATLDYAIRHTMKEGPAMTDSINAIVAARLGEAQESLDLFHSSYRPFMRGPWDAFSEKRSTDNVYFCTGMGGCLQTVLYGFAGLNLSEPGIPGQGTKIASSGTVSLYANPHLPPGWTGMTVMGVQFHGHSYDVTVGAGNSVTVVKKG